MTTLRRRPLLLLPLMAAPAWAAGTPAGPVLLMRHAQTDPGVGDPPGFVLGRCATQRNLSPEGRAHARAFGARLGTLALRPGGIRSSRWCRCLHTGDEIAAALGEEPGLKPEPWFALDSFFDDRLREPAQTAALRQRLGTLRGPGFELWVTHQGNIAALTGAGASMGQAQWLWTDAAGRVATAPFG